MPFRGPRPPTTAQLNTILALTVGNLTPYQLDQLRDALNTIKNGRQADDLAGANESNLTTLFANYA